MVRANTCLFDYMVNSSEGEEVSLTEFHGRVCLVVNTASRCGFTSQYRDLEDLFQKYQTRGFCVLAFPSNDFANQEPGSDSEIRQFCDTSYRITFPIFKKGHVRGENKQPVYRFLTELSTEEYRGDPGWNFVKFLVDREGQVAARYSSIVTPRSKKLKKKIEELLSSIPK